MLHVKQEVQSSEKSVLEVVLEADIERSNLLRKEKELMEKQQTISEDNVPQLQAVMNELSELYERMTQIGAHSAEGRAARLDKTKNAFFFVIVFVIFFLSLSYLILNITFFFIVFK